MPCLVFVSFSHLNHSWMLLAPLKSHLQILVAVRGETLECNRPKVVTQVHGFLAGTSGKYFCFHLSRELLRGCGEHSMGWCFYSGFFRSLFSPWHIYVLCSIHHHYLFHLVAVLGLQLLGIHLKYGLQNSTQYSRWDLTTLLLCPLCLFYLRLLLIALVIQIGMVALTITLSGSWRMQMTCSHLSCHAMVRNSCHWKCNLVRDHQHRGLAS